ncbi:TIGR00730 family Rossman fold protein [uncultured Thiohalocapsa sp.]|uniref:LOG family protein n=1 Tax=uncultured Thiohalocapsa sp. TaxID=768990 RepID=UPI0025E2A3CD|nr:TIGR00730 family Rossman fold protein [uncultured Thiohalocapsa sp.]
MKRVCVYTGGYEGRQAIFAETARAMGEELARREVELVYGGGQVGLMGILADTVLENGGRVIGVIPEKLAAREIAHHDLQELRIVGSMHERKALMETLSCGFIALPGGIGTLEETCEALTWAQLGVHKKPCGLINAGGYYDHFLAFIDTMVDNGFLKAVHRELLLVDKDPAALLDRMAVFEPPEFKRWMAREDV